MLAQTATQHKTDLERLLRAQLSLLSNDSDHSEIGRLFAQTMQTSAAQHSS